MHDYLVRRTRYLSTKSIKNKKEQKGKYYGRDCHTKSPSEGITVCMLFFIVELVAKLIVVFSTTLVGSIVFTKV